MPKTAAYGQNISSLKLRFVPLWNRLCGRSGGDALFERLVSAYSQPHRFYHTLYHINQALHEYDAVRSHAEHPDHVELAIWFHDSVYDPPGTAHDGDHEERSAAWAAEELAACGVPKQAITNVKDLILATRHDSAPQTRDARLLSDIDLAIFGKPRPLFDDYERSIRQERAPFPEEEYRKARIRSMERFLSRSHIYQTRWFRERYETTARENLKRLIQILAKGLPAHQARYP